MPASGVTFTNFASSEIPLSGTSKVRIHAASLVANSADGTAAANAQLTLNNMKIFLALNAANGSTLLQIKLCSLTQPIVLLDSATGHSNSGPMVGGPFPIPFEFISNIIPLLAVQFQIVVTGDAANADAVNPHSILYNAYVMYELN